MLPSGHAPAPGRWTRHHSRGMRGTTRCGTIAPSPTRGDRMQSIVTFVLIGVTVFVSWQAFGNRALLERLILWTPAIDRHKQYDRLVTHGFIHADLGHLLFNMITLFFFGRPVEQVFVERIGAIGFVLFYLSAIVVAILPTWLRHRHDALYRSLGASGAVSAVLFAFILMAPWTGI